MYLFTKIRLEKGERSKASLYLSSSLLLVTPISLDELDRANGFEIFQSLSESKIGWLFNIVAVTVEDPATKRTTQVIE